MRTVRNFDQLEDASCMSFLNRGAFQSQYAFFTTMLREAAGVEHLVDVEGRVFRHRRTPSATVSKSQNTAMLRVS